MDDDVQKVKDRTNIVEVVGQYVPLKRAGRTYTARCPFHKERTPSFHVSAERGTYKCFGCGEGGDVFTFVQKMDGVDFPTALKQLAEKAGVTLAARSVKGKTPEQKDKEERLFEVCEAAIAFFGQELHKRSDVQGYIRTRGVQQETSTEWRLGYAPATWDALSKHLTSIGFSQQEVVDAGFAMRSEKRKGELFDRFRGRIIFPMFDPSGRPVAVSGRFFERVPGQKMEGEPAKYVNSPETPLFKKSKILYGFDRARPAIRKADCILLVEGQFDLILAHQSGLPFTVALSGTALTPEHLTLLSRLSKRLVLALDADSAGIKAGLKSARMATAAGFDIKVPVLPVGQDPADVARENPELLKAAIRTSKTAVEFFLDAVQAGARDERAYKKRVEAEVLPLIAAMGSSIEQEHFAAVVAARLGVSAEAVRTEVSKQPSPERVVEGAADSSPELHKNAGEFGEFTPLEKKVGMVLFGWEEGRGKLLLLLGEERLGQLEERLGAAAENFRFGFDREVGEHTTPEAIATDMLGYVEDIVRRERYKLKAV